MRQSRMPAQLAPRSPVSPIRSGSQVGTVQMINVVTMVIGFLLFMLAPTQVSSGFLWITVALGILTILAQIYLKVSSERPVNWVSIDLVVLSGFFLVHFVYVFLYLVGYFSSRNPWRSYRLDASDVVCTTEAVAVVGIAALAFGLNIHPPSPPRPLALPHVPLNVFANWCRLASAVIRIGAVLFVVWVATAGVGVVFGGKYTGSGFGGTETSMWLQLCRGFLSIGVCMAVIIGVQHRALWARMQLDLGLAAAVAFAILLHGDRSTAVQLMFPLLFALSEYRRPFRLRTLLAAFLALLFLMGVSQIARRQFDRTVGGFAAAARETGWESMLLSVTTYSGSVFTAYAAVQHVPHKHDYFYGKMQLPHLVGIIPFSRRALGIRGTDYNSSKLVTEIILGPDSPIGAGSSMVAETYFDGGVIGVGLMLGLAGYILRRIEKLARERPSIVYAGVHGIAFAAMLIAARNSVFGYIIRQVIYPGLFVVAVAYALAIPTSYARRAIVSRTPQRARS